MDKVPEVGTQVIITQEAFAADFRFKKWGDHWEKSSEIRPEEEVVIDAPLGRLLWDVPGEVVRHSHLNPMGDFVAKFIGHNGRQFFVYLRPWEVAPV